MSSISRKPLQILNASAGSGKTYNLVLTYLRLIIGNDSSPLAFSSIMAMTFTNKAAFEMKSRIISALDMLGNPIRENAQETEKARKYALSVAEKLECNVKEIQPKAKKALKLLLHQYEDFNVMTIDKFNLRLIRSFSRDLDIDSDFEIILDENLVLDQVIDQLLDGLDPIVKSKFTQLVVNYSRQKVKDQESWNFQRDLKQFATLLTNEKYFGIIKEMIAADFSENAFEALTQDLENQISQLTKKAEQIHQSFYAIPNWSNLPGKSRTFGPIDQLKSDKLLQGNSVNNGYFTDTFIKQLEKKEFPADFKEEVLHFQEFYEQEIQEIHLLKLVRKNFYNMALLQFIAEELEHVKQHDRLIRISEFNKLISELIEKEEAPFIYERLGNRFQHFLLDEFQDTSRLQWTNIVPLVHESLSHDFSNLIVGDPKQSIYRFKNGLAEQFVVLPAIYNPENDPVTSLKSAYFSEQGEKLSLQENWRSSQNIVHFNNAFFNHFKNNYNALLTAYYADVEQFPKGKKGGYIHLLSEETEDLAQTTNQLITWINECLDDGYEKGEICILGNTKKDCNAWAIALTNLGHKVVSADSLLVNSDHFVRLTIAYLKWRKNPSGELEARQFSELYFSLKSQNSIANIQKYWKNKVLEHGKTFQYFDTNSFFIEQFGSEELFFFPFENLYNLVQGFYKIAHLEEIHNPYLHHLSDMVHEFDNRKGPELDQFLEFYQLKGKNAAIQIPENKDAIKIMTGHKSKGLEFEVVILPSMDWNITGAKSSFLLKEKNRFLYAPLSKKSKIDRIRTENEIEYNQSLLDKINLCYVMFTRPVDRLYIANFHNQTAESNFGSALHELVNSLHVDSIVKQEKNQENQRIELKFGERTNRVKAHDNEEQDFNFTPISLEDKLWFPSISLKEKNINKEDSLSENQRFGNQLHLLLAEINQFSAIEKVLDEKSKAGLIEVVFLDQLRNSLNAIFSMPTYLELIENAEQILNEQDIIVSPTEVKRPDKIILKTAESIVLDYKTGVPKAQHLKQIQQYTNILHEMGYQNVRGVVFYTQEMRIVRAESVE